MPQAANRLRQLRHSLDRRLAAGCLAETWSRRRNENSGRRRGGRMKQNPTIDKLMKMIAKFRLRDSGTPIFANHPLHRLGKPEGWKTEVSISKAASYDEDLTEIIASGFERLGVARE